jgi:hypothetical protein
MLPVLWFTTSSTKVNEDIPYDFLLGLPQPNRELSSAINSTLSGILVLFYNPLLFAFGGQANLFLRSKNRNNL